MNSNRKSSMLSINASRNKPLPPIIIDDGSNKTTSRTKSHHVAVEQTSAPTIAPADELHNSSSQMFQPKTLKRRNLKKLTLEDSNSGASTNDASSPSFKNYSGLSTPGSSTSMKNEEEFVENFEKLTISINDRYKLRQKDILILKTLGEGQSGTVTKILHVPTNKIMAKKQIMFEKNFKVQNQILRELKILNDVKNEYIIEFYGAIFIDSSSNSSNNTNETTKDYASNDEVDNENSNDISNPNANTCVKQVNKNAHPQMRRLNVTDEGPIFNSNGVLIFTEYMDCGSLDTILKKLGSLKEVYLSKITFNVLQGLNYLYSKHKIIHRDIKPSNVLLNSKGEVKICDFGVSRELNNNSIADTFVGTSTYMSPERIQGDVYNIKGDVWSLGLMLIELATGEFPLGKKDTPNGILDLLQRIVNEKPPALPRDKYSPELCDFVDLCLRRQSDRPTPLELLSAENSFLTKHSNEDGMRLLRHLAKKLRKN